MQKRKIQVEQRRGYYSALGYHSVAAATAENRVQTGGSGAHYQRHDRGKLLNQARDFSRNNGIFRGMIERAVSYIVGNGFALQASTEDDEWNAKVEALWKEAWRRPEVRGILSGPRVERMVCREMLTVGDTGIIKLGSHKIQLIEAEQINGGRKAGDGIAKTKEGAPKKFYVAPYGRGGKVQTGAAQEYTPGEFLFLTDPERPSMVRSTPPCQASFPMLHRINDVCDSEAAAWQMVARLAVSLTRERGPQFSREESRPDPDKASGDLGGDAATRITELDVALIFHGEPGDEIKAIKHDVPGKDFSASIRMFLRMLGLPLGLPLEIILLDWTKSNYSQSRAVLEQAFQVFQGWQSVLVDFGHSDIYRWLVDWWVSEGRLADRDDKHSHGWITPTFPWIDQLKEAQAQGAKIERGFTTHSEVCKSLGREREDVVATRKREVLSAIETAMSIEQASGVPVPWQIFAGLAIPGQATTEMASAALVKEDNDDNEE